MSKLNYQKLSYDSRMSQQPVVNAVPKKKDHKKVNTLSNAPRRKFDQAKPQSLWQAINNETTFLSGKYQGSNIGSIIKQDPGYLLWVLDNHPTGIVAQQINVYYSNQADKK